MKVILEKSDTGYSAYVKESSGLYTSGESIQEVKDNMDEVIEIQSEYLKEQGKLEEARELQQAEVGYYLDVKQFFDEYKFINKSAFAEAIGEKPSYIGKISSGIVKLSDAKALKIQEGLHELGKELLSVNFV